MSNSSDPPRLVILSEKRPSLSLEDLLLNCEFLPEERASVCIWLFVCKDITHLHN
jgi:hypothetical protein